VPEVIQQPFLKLCSVFHANFAISSSFLLVVFARTFTLLLRGVGADPVVCVNGPVEALFVVFHLLVDLTNIILEKLLDDKYSKEFRVPH
jgi:hypothetical protein